MRCLAAKHQRQPIANKCPSGHTRAFALIASPATEGDCPVDPLAALFTRDGLQTVTMPVLLFRPEQSQLSGEGNAIGLAAALPSRPQDQVLPGGHFVFVDTCLPVREAVAPEWCRDPTGVDRDVVHAEVESMIAKFFAEKSLVDRLNLGSGTTVHRC